MTVVRFCLFVCLFLRHVYLTFYYYFSVGLFIFLLYNIILLEGDLRHKDTHTRRPPEDWVGWIVLYNQGTLNVPEEKHGMDSFLELPGGTSLVAT